MKKKLSIIGGGTAALILASELDPGKYSVSIYERNAAPGRKFLVAGDGGLNLTHSESKDKFLQRYTPSSFLKEAFDHFSNEDLIKWFNNLGVETFVGSSGRVFPAKGIKPAEVLSLIIKKIKQNNVTLHYKHTWKGFAADDLLIESNGKENVVKSDIVIFCLGGASWPVTGSKGEWPNYFKEKKITVNEFKASNCAFKIEWPADLVNKIEGKVLKNVSISCKGKHHAGEVVLTKSGIEGSGIYPLSPEIRRQLGEHGKAQIIIDLKPSLTEDKIIAKIKHQSKNISETLKSELNFNQTHIQLLKAFVSKEEFLDIEKLSFHIKSFGLTISALGPVEDAISTTGGIALTEINYHFELKKLPSRFVIGEMLDYDAPTGGYLLQSCFTMGKFLADYLNKKEN
ncbi:MAG: NAD(P)/FAD-dependent oxidoreductase [Bacteroidia bacterium]